MMLPTEILDIVFSQIHLKTAAPTSESQATFSSLCLTSKHFLPLAREYLYYRPLDSDTKITWKKAFSMIEALVNGDYRLAQLVGSLEGLVYWIVKLGDLDDPPAVWFSIAGCTKTFSWYLTILKSCSKLVSVDLLFNNERHKTMVLNALKSSSASLKRIGLVNSSSRYRLDDHMVRSACSHASMKGIEDLKLVNIVFWHSNVLKPSLPLRVKTLELASYNLSNTVHLLPHDPSTLRSFSLEYNYSDKSELPVILGFLPSTLERLSVTHMPRSSISGPPQLHSYLQPVPSLGTIPITSLASFPHLSTLALKGFAGSIMRLLDTLSPSSQSLTTIDLENSTWTRSNESEESFPEKKILELIATFSQLRYLHLGYLPTTTNEKYEAFKTRLNGLEIRVEWDNCLPRQVCTCLNDWHDASCHVFRH